MNDAEKVIADPSQDVLDIMDYLPTLSAASESTARTDLLQSDGSTLAVESHAGAAATLRAEPPLATD